MQPYRRIKHIIGSALVAGAIAWSIYDWVVIENGPAYFAADWRRIALLGLITVVGSLATLAFLSLPSVARQCLTMISFGAGAVFATVFCGYTCWQFIRLSSFLSDSGELWLVAGIELFLVMVTALIWIMFWKHCKSAHSQRRV